MIDSPVIVVLVIISYTLGYISGWLEGRKNK